MPWGSSAEVYAARPVELQNNRGKLSTNLASAGGLILRFASLEIAAWLRS